MRVRFPGLCSLGTTLLMLHSACGGDDNPMASASNSTPGTSVTTVSATDALTSTTEPGTGSPTEAGTDGSDSLSGDVPTTGGTSMTVGCELACPQGQYCVGGTCQPGCADDTDCTAPQTCDLADHTCKGCSSDAGCPLGSVCEAGACVAGCNAMQPCSDGLTCCAEACVDPLNDPDHCGGCDPCPSLPHAGSTCSMGQCGLGGCDAGWNDCDNNPNNGCETQGACQCQPGAVQACYSGPGGTEGVGVCKGGTHTCNPEGTGWGPCDGEVLPAAAEVCGNGLDDNCNGQVDEDADADGDGWTVCGGDCCDVIGANCLNPNLVNPGAFEVAGNMVDDDCDGTKDNVLAACDGGLSSSSSQAMDYARAMDLCQTTTEDPPLGERKWGVISGSFSRSSGSGTPAAAARAIRPGFGSVIKPQKDASLVVLSTGHAADQNDSNPGYAAFQGGAELETPAAVPADWLAANGGSFPNAPGCPNPEGGATGQDTIQLKLRIRVPTNALSFSAHVYFFSSEYPEWVCSPYNDFFLTLVDGMGANNPADKNIAVYKNQSNQLFPLGVNILKGAPGLFSQCTNGQISCAFPPTASYNSCTGNGELAGTGFHLTNPGPKFAADPGYCGSNNQVGGGTGWLKMSGNVKPGETMELRFVLWDTSDPWYDSVVLLDNFEWSLQASEPGVKPG